MQPELLKLSSSLLIKNKILEKKHNEKIYLLIYNDIRWYLRDAGTKRKMTIIKKSLWPMQKEKRSDRPARGHDVWTRQSVTAL